MIETRSLVIGGWTTTQSPNHSIAQSPNCPIAQFSNRPIAQSPARRARSADAHGFTLIEMMVVLVVIGIFVGLVSSISQPDDRAMLRVEAERLAQLLDLASMQARLGGRPVAWTADGPGYRFWRFSEDTYWSEILDDDSLRARSLPRGMVIAALRIENLRPPENMRLEFSPYGAASAFRIELVLGTARSTVAGSPLGDVRILPEQEKEKEKENGKLAR